MTELLMLTQIAFIVIMAMYLIGTRKGEKDKKSAMESSARAQSVKLTRMRQISLTEPLTEKTRPKKMSDVIGQDDGIRALCAALCGKNPQHIIIYGPPGVGKTCAARLALEQAKLSNGTPFLSDAKFIEIDATAIRFDERAIADPLIGSVHDPIYQGAGCYGQAGVPQPKAGAVTKAHGGVLFLDEIGELHPVQLNKLLKVMEDRRVFFESAYYVEGDASTPQYIHDVFRDGFPADFRLIGATTRRPEEISPAIRSRCIEVFFRPLYEDELVRIAKNAMLAGGVGSEPGAAELAASYSSSGRDAVNIVQLACGVVLSSERHTITCEDIEWIARAGRYARHSFSRELTGEKNCIINAMGVSGDMRGFVFEIECCIAKAENGRGVVSVSGFAEREELKTEQRSYYKKSSAVCSVENVLSVLKRLYGLDTSGCSININAVGAPMVEGPSAGLALAVLIYSAFTGKPIPSDTAFTGEMGLNGDIRPVGGVREKTEAAAHTGINTVFMPAGNAGEEDAAVKCVIHVSRLDEALEAVFGRQSNNNIEVCEMLTASGA